MAGEIITHPQQVSGLPPKAYLDKILNVPVGQQPTDVAIRRLRALPRKIAALDLLSLLQQRGGTPTVNAMQCHLAGRALRPVL
jgi:hypothetical protein